MADETTETVRLAEPTGETPAENSANLDAMVIDDFAALVYLNEPEPEYTQRVFLAVGDIVKMNFDINGQTLVLDGEDLRIEFDNGGVIVLEGFATLADEGFAPLLAMPDGAMIPGDILVSALAEVSIETAAGEAAASGGAGEYRADMGDVLGGINKLGVQDPDPFAADSQQAVEEEQTPLPENQPPLAEDDPIQVNEDDSVTFNVLDNDSDPEDDPLTVVDYTQPEHGEIVDNGDGSFTYTPEPDYSGPDEFEYTIDDGQGGTDTATVTIDVIPEPIITVNGGVEGSDIDVPEGTDAVFTVNIEDAAAGSSLTLSLADGTAIDADYNEAYFQYDLGDGNGWQDVTGPITIGEGNTTLLVRTDTYDDTIDEADETFALNATLTSQGTDYDASGTATIIDNDPPETSPDSYSVDEDEILDVDASDDLGPTPDALNGVLFNDTDASGGGIEVFNPGTLTKVYYDEDLTQEVTGATLSVQADGSFTLDQGGNFNALDEGESDFVYFKYQATDGTNASDQTLATIQINGVNDGPLITTDSGNPEGDDDVVYESGLPEGSGIAPVTINADGTFTVSDPDGLDDIASISIAGSTPFAFMGGVELADLVGNSFETTHGEITITGYDNGTYSYTYTLGEATKDVDGVTETDSFDVTVSDGALSASASINIEIVDDVPTAVDDYATVSPGQYGSTNLMLVVDLSGSMDNTVDYNGTSMTRLAATKLAVGDLLDSYDSTSDTAVRIVTFSSTANAVGDTWMTVEAAQAYFDSLSDTAGSGSTNYDAALSVAQSAFNDAGKLAGAQNVSYFLSDGIPTTSMSHPDGNSGSTYNPELGDGIGEEGIVGSDSEVSRQEWEAFATDNAIVSYAIGVGTGATQGTLDPIAWDGKSGTDLDGIVVTEESELSDVLQTTVIVNPVTGNVLTNDTSGADGWADPALVSVEFGGTTYTFDASNHSFEIDLGADKGTLVIEEDGDYTLTPPPDGSSGAPIEVDYTVVDGDGDESSATLTIVNPLLVIGSNDDDSGDSTSDHYLPNPALVPDVDGDIVGGKSADVLIGDPGGTTLEAGDTGNFVLVLDTSGSMSADISFGAGSISRLEALKLATVDTLTQLANSGAENVRVHIVEFNTNADTIGSTGGTYDLIVDGVVNSAALGNAIDDINTLNDGGYTNYEAGLQTAQEWIESSAPLENAESNKLLFISDGEPNRALNDSDDVISVNAQNAIDHILGVDDSTDEVTSIESAGFTIEAIGINVNSTALGYLDQVEGAAGDADNITTAEQLGVLVSDLAGATTIEKAVGSDTLHGGDGDDVIFGDTPNTDALNSDGPTYGDAGTHDGAGYAVLVDHLGSDQAALNHLSDPDNAQQYNVSGDTRGEGDLIDGGAGNDTIFGQGGDDVIYGGDGDDAIFGGTGNDTIIAGDGLDQLLGDEGEDTFAFSALGGDGENAILDFNPGSDTLRLHDVLDTDTSGDYTIADLDNVNMTVVDSDTIILDITGQAGREDTSITLHAADGTDFSSINSLDDLPVEVTPDTYSS